MQTTIGRTVAAVLAAFAVATALIGCGSGSGVCGGTPDGPGGLGSWAEADA